jgi:hypothetical protein
MTMLNKYYDFNFELSIDGQPYPSEKAAPLFQHDPFPGAHKYSCVISGKRLGKLFDYIALERNETVSEEDARRFFLSLGLSWNSDGEGDASLEYFLNSVEEIDYDGERLRFSGICSAVVRG